MKKLKIFFWILIIVIFTILFFSCEKKANTDIKAFNGILNLSNYNFNQYKEVKLEGMWDLYYGELLEPYDIKLRTAKTFYNIPGRLKDQISGKNQGYMTLHLKIYVPKDENYGIYFNSLFTSSDIWINGVYLSGHGKVGTNILDEKAIYRPQYIFFSSINKEVDIVIHTSTYKDLEPSLKAATFGTQQQIMQLNYKNVVLDGFMIGIMFIMGILSFGFYFTELKPKKNIYFSIICLLMLLRCLVYNSRLLVEFYPNLPFEVLSKLAAITFYLPVTFYILFLNEVFHNETIIKYMAIFYGAGFSTLCILTNNLIYDRAGIYGQLIFVFFIVYLFTLFIKEILNKNLNAKKNFFPFIIICLTGVNDILVNNSVLFNPYTAIYGVILFIIMESMFIINDYLEKHRKLDYINKDGLTSLYNNKYIKELLSMHLNKYIHKNEKFSLLMIDIDNFKGINDTFGHMFGDTVIVDTANMLHNIIDDKGYVGRFGGDEFIIILPKIIKKDAVIFAKKIMDQLEILNKKYSITRRISLSIGVYENDVNDLSQCIDKVDASMYKAKNSGKNCINSISV